MALAASTGIQRLVSPNMYLNYSLSVLLIAYLVTLFLMLMLRYSIKILYANLKQETQPAIRALVFGAGDLGLVVREKLENTGKERIKVVAFIDDNTEKIGKRVSGLPVYDDSVLNEHFLTRQKITKLVLAVQNLSVLRKNQIMDLCLEHNLEVRTVPRVEDWVKGRLSQKQIRKVSIEELMARDTIKLDCQMISEKIKGKVVLVTGAAGSIGSELARQINRMQPARLVLLDQAETPLFELEQSFRSRENGGSAPKDYVLADISQASCMRRIFESYSPQLSITPQPTSTFL
jgi:FlaA1/EpsC-like NDP-sugar epimerase